VSWTKKKTDDDRTHGGEPEVSLQKHDAYSNIRRRRSPKTCSVRERRGGEGEEKREQGGEDSYKSNTDQNFRKRVRVTSKKPEIAYKD